MRNIKLKTKDMKATELRINNYVNYDNEIHLISGLNDIGGVCKITNLKGKVISQHTTNLDPITLTEERLINFGFTSNPYQDNYYLNGFILDINKTRGKLEIYYKHVEIEFVHTLQNLYFALTNEELTLTNKNNERGNNNI